MEMVETIKAIETHYQGCRFRSRLEARWATFFDAIGVKWAYELEGFEINGERYLPDFWLENSGMNGMWVEIKPVRLTDRELRLLVGLAKLSGHSAIAICGQPWMGEYSIAAADRLCNGELIITTAGEMIEWETCTEEDGSTICIQHWGSDGGTVGLSYLANMPLDSDESQSERNAVMGRRLWKAFEAARGARFGR